MKIVQNTGFQEIIDIKIERTPVTPYTTLPMILKVSALSSRSLQRGEKVSAVPEGHSQLDFKLSILLSYLNCLLSIQEVHWE